MTGILTVINGNPFVKVGEKLYLTTKNCTLTKHTSGYWNFNMSLDAIYTAYREGDIVRGGLCGDIFIAWAFFPSNPYKS
jgi:hypothetical protein